MASGVSSVVIRGPNGRRHTIRVSPNTSILQVLEEACNKLGMKPDDYDLKHGNKTLDLSLAVRFANIPNNAVLELHPADRVRKEGNVTVGIQLESGERLTADFPPSFSLWDVVTQCLSQSGASPDRGDDGLSVPVCVYMRQMISGEELKKCTLRSLGLTHGKAMFRLMYRQVDQLKEQAHVAPPRAKNTAECTVSEPSDSFQSDELLKSVTHKQPDSVIQEENEGGVIREQFRRPTSSTVVSNSLSNFSNSEAVDMKPERSFPSELCVRKCPESTIPENINLSGFITSPVTEKNEVVSENLNLEASSNHESMMDVDSVPDNHEDKGVEGTGTITIIGGRNALLFNLNDILDTPKIVLPDDFYEVTVQDVRYLLEEYKRVRLEIENKPLELRSQKQNDNLQRLAKYAQTVIRIQFPNRLVLQGVFSVDETIKSVMEFVRSFLENEQLNFYLYISPPKTNLLPDKTLLECRLMPAAVVYFGSEDCHSSYLKPVYGTQLSDPGAANRAAAEFRSKNILKIPSSQNSVHIDENVNDEVDEVDPQQNLDAPSTSSAQSIRRSDHSDSSKVPKWLKLSRQ